ncbi:MAG: type IV pilus assembly protein PilW [Oleispira sp.]|jgi:type IV pilus assembly protein PilW
MKNTKQSNGFTLVELMITLVLSLAITYGIAQVLITSNRSSITSDGLSQSQETGRFVMSFLAKTIRQGGLNSIGDIPKTTNPLISCTEFPGLMNDDDVAGNHQCSFDSILGGDPDDNPGDRLAIAWIPPVPLDASGDPDPTLIRDCSGAGGFDENDIILNVFWVAADETSGMNSLFCQGHTFDGTAITRSNTKQAIANGVDSMHILYGEATQPVPVPKNRNVSRYTHGGDPATGGVALVNWDQVYAIKVSILTRSLTEVTNQVALRRYVLLDAQPYTLTDAVNRQVFNSSFVINNY